MLFRSEKAQMIDAGGRPVIVGWPEYQELWLRAAVSLPKRDRWEAYENIAEMTNRSLASVKRRAEALQAEDRRLAREFLALHLRKDWQSDCGGSRQAFVPARTIQGRHLVTPRSAFSVSEAAKMSGNARTVKARAAE